MAYSGQNNISACVLHRSGSQRRFFSEYGIVHVVDIPNGLELLVVSKLSAALGTEIGEHRAVVELNYLLPLNASGTGQQGLGRKFQLSETAGDTTAKICEWWQSRPGLNLNGRIGILDSGVNWRQIPARRRLAAYDYEGDEATWLFGYSEPDDAASLDHDNLGHGTRVITILERLLPINVDIVSGRIGSTDNYVTVLRAARAYAHLVSKERPDVVNLSLAPIDDEVACPGGEAAQVPAFHTNLLPFIFAITSHVTLPVMAAGNRGQPCNARFVLRGTEPPIFAVALNSNGRPASYSNYVDGTAALWLGAFGGDDVDDKDGSGIFSDERATIGTSFAAPFVTAAVYLATKFKGRHHGRGEDLQTFGVRCAEVLRGA